MAFPESIQLTIRSLSLCRPGTFPEQPGTYMEREALDKPLVPGLEETASRKVRPWIQDIVRDADTVYGARY